MSEMSKLDRADIDRVRTWARETLDLMSGPKRVTLKALVYYEDGRECVYNFNGDVVLSGTDVLTMSIKDKLFIKMGVDRDIVLGDDTNKSRAERRRKEREDEKRAEARDPLRLIALE